MKWRLLFVPFAFLTVGIIRAIAKRRLVRFGEIWSTRLGHLVGNTECYLCEVDAGRHPANAYDIWCSTAGSAHPLIERKYRKRLHTWPRWWVDLVVRVNRLFTGWDKYEVGPAQFDRDIYNLWEKHGPHIGFTEREERRGQKLLRSLGIPEGAKWVCLIVRDSSYLKAMSAADFSYHDHRDSDIHNYVPAVLELVNRGYYVIRMGKVAERRLLIKHSMVIDYAFHPKQSDFGQFYLGAKCEFCFGASTGFMCIPQAFLRPTVVVNFIPLHYLHTWLRGIVIWKHHVRDGKRMTIPEILDGGAGAFMEAGQFHAAGITLEENTSEEIFDAVMEMVDGLSIHPQPEFWRQYPLGTMNNMNGRPLHGEARVRIGREFLRGYS